MKFSAFWLLVRSYLVSNFGWEVGYAFPPERVRAKGIRSAATWAHMPELFDILHRKYEEGPTSNDAQMWADTALETAQEIDEVA